MLFEAPSKAKFHYDDENPDKKEFQLPAVNDLVQRTEVVRYSAPSPCFGDSIQFPMVKPGYLIWLARILPAAPPNHDHPMPRKRKKKIVRLIYQSEGPLPLRYGDRFADCLLVFSDASLKRQGGMAAVLFGDADGAPLVATRSVPLTGSNELELQAALFALQQARQHFPGRRLALFSDNRDAVSRLSRGREEGLLDDPVLAGMLGDHGISDILSNASIHWIKSHATCRGNTLADQHAGMAAE